MSSFSFATTPRIVSGVESLGELPTYLAAINAIKILIVSDRGIESVGLLKTLTESLSGFEYECFLDVQADPSEAVVLSATQQAIAFGAQAIIGYGGGSSMDTAKVVSVLMQQRQGLADIYGVNQVAIGRTPLILIPTTAGTGSEVTPISIITTGETTKAGIVSPVLLPDIAILDASLTIGLPPQVTAATGIDAMVHAIEAYTSKLKKNEYSDMLACKALTLLSDNIHQATHNGKDLAARQAMLFGACLAGQAFANAPVAAVHALAYPLGGHFHIPHGLSNSLVLPHVMRFNADACLDLYAEIANLLLPDVNTDASKEDLTRSLILYLETLIESLGLPSTLSEMGISRNDLPKLAEDAMLQQRLLVNNPKEVTYVDALAIYERAFE
ncbi:iron-containing alcohol dehydrogenase [Glaciecola sp. 1036]|uniref:iron-containing alcohol dehydrogenase n=1 Tax=Alteromonadaceae TaxID=72275 RepID=UPI003CFBCC6E